MAKLTESHCLSYLLPSGCRCTVLKALLMLYPQKQTFPQALLGPTVFYQSHLLCPICRPFSVITMTVVMILKSLPLRSSYRDCASSSTTTSYLIYRHKLLRSFVPQPLPLLAHRLWYQPHYSGHSGTERRFRKSKLLSLRSQFTMFKVCSRHILRLHRPKDSHRRGVVLM